MKITKSLLLINNNLWKFYSTWQFLCLLGLPMMNFWENLSKIAWSHWKCGLCLCNQIIKTLNLTVLVRALKVKLYGREKHWVRILHIFTLFSLQKMKNILSLWNFFIWFGFLTALLEHRCRKILKKTAQKPSPSLVFFKKFNLPVWTL